MTELHAILAGPVKDPNRNRTVQHGAVRVEGNSLRLRLNDERHVRLTLDDTEAMRQLGRALIEEADRQDLYKRVRECDL